MKTGWVIGMLAGLGIGITATPVSAQTVLSSDGISVSCLVGEGEPSLILTADNLSWMGFVSSNLYRFNSSVITCDAFIANSPSYALYVFHTNGLNRQAMWGKDSKTGATNWLPVKIVWGEGNYMSGTPPNPMDTNNWVNAYRYIIDYRGTRSYQMIMSGRSSSAKPFPMNFAVDATGLPEAVYRGAVFIELFSP